MKIFLAIITFSLLVDFATAGTVKKYEIKHDGLDRSYIVYQPDGLEKKPTPVMLVLHGGTGNAKYSLDTMEFQSVADQEKFIVVFANGTGTFLGTDRRVWNAGDCCGAAVRKNIDDVGFIQKLLKDLKSNFAVDEGKIYVTGMSNGAMMTYRLICELPNTFAAAIPVAGAVAVDRKCEHGAEVAIMHVHGLKDESVPFLGGKSKGLVKALYKPTMDYLNIFTKMKKCGDPKTSPLTDGDEVLDFNCGSFPPVKLVKLKNMPHAWPGGSGPRAKNETKFSAPLEAWNFAKNFSLK